MERLDRGLGNGDWRSLFTRATVRHLPRHASDQAPLLLDTMGDTDRCSSPFRFEAIWAQDKRSDEIINKAWHFHGSGSPSYVLCQHLKATKAALRSWNRTVFGDVMERVSSLQRELDENSSKLVSRVEDSGFQLRNVRFPLSFGKLNNRKNYYGAQSPVICDLRPRILVLDFFTSPLSLAGVVIAFRLSILIRAHG